LNPRALPPQSNSLCDSQRLGYSQVQMDPGLSFAKQVDKVH
jgi:hypothetical protein